MINLKTLINDKFGNPVWCRRSPSSSNPRAHKIVETPAGREYIPDTNSNNIINLDTIYPPPSDPELKRGYMLRPCGTNLKMKILTVFLLAWIFAKLKLKTLQRRKFLEICFYFEPKLL